MPFSQQIDGNAGRYRLKSDGALEIVSLYRNDTGVYICVADNGLGQARQEIRLVVNGEYGEHDASLEIALVEGVSCCGLLLHINVLEERNFSLCYRTERNGILGLCTM